MADETMPGGDGGAEAEERAIREALDRYVAGKPFRYHPDPAVVRRIVSGLAKRKAKTGLALCPCRLATGKPELDQKIVCPCVYHEEEIAAHGRCHCRLFVSDRYAGD